MFRPPDDPIREGARGGHDRFSWEEVKANNQKEKYLGNSVKIPNTKFNYGKDFFWYEKNSQISVADKDSKAKELEEIRRKEKELMDLALGIQPSVSTEPPLHEVDKGKDMEDSSLKTSRSQNYEKFDEKRRKKSRDKKEGRHRRRDRGRRSISRELRSRSPKKRRGRSKERRR